MNRCVRAASGGGVPVSSLDIDAAITSPADMTLEQAEQLSLLEPYGAGNPRPVFALLGATVDAVPSPGKAPPSSIWISTSVFWAEILIYPLWG